MDENRDAIKRYEDHFEFQQSLYEMHVSGKPGPFKPGTIHKCRQVKVIIGQDEFTVSGHISEDDFKLTLQDQSSFVKVYSGTVEGKPTVFATHRIREGQEGWGKSRRDWGSYKIKDPEIRGLTYCKEWDLRGYLDDKRIRIFPPEGISHERHDAALMLAQRNLALVLAQKSLDDILYKRAPFRPDSPLGNNFFDNATCLYLEAMKAV